MTNIRYPIAAAICWLAFAVTLRSMLRGKNPRYDPASIALTASFGCQGVYLLLSTPKAWAGSLFGEVTWYNVSVQMWMIATIGCQQVLLAYWLQGRDARYRIWWRLLPLCGAIAAMAVLFALASRNGHPRNTFAEPAEQQLFVAYQAVYLTTYSLGKIAIARTSWRFHSRASEPWVQRGLQLAAIGALVDLIYAAGRIADVFLTQYGWAAARWSYISRTSLTVGIALNVIGWTAPVWGSWLSSLVAKARDYRRYRQLHPLWRTLTAARPEVVLVPPPRYAPAVLGNLRFHLHRRVVEIRDGCLALTRADQKAQQEPRDTGVSAQDAAALIYAALEAGPCQEICPTRPPLPGLILNGPGDTDEIEWLVEVSQAFTRLQDHAATTGIRE
ncbi:MAB_1171c family putative transporter [Streptomyces sp. NPDC001621]|uniref:MAB_1171c family putative transporter n=1 Tax=Streptomyces sp. NPDC001621 TaxID=3364594 RepID=UPI0036AD7E28